MDAREQMIVEIYDSIQRFYKNRETQVKIGEDNSTLVIRCIDVSDSTIKYEVETREEQQWITCLK